MDKDQNSQGLPLWHGRFNVSSADVLRNLNSSIGFDLRLYREDITASKAHAKMLETIGIYDEVELSEVLKGVLKKSWQKSKAGVSLSCQMTKMCTLSSNVV